MFIIMCEGNRFWAQVLDIIANAIVRIEIKTSNHFCGVKYMIISPVDGPENLRATQEFINLFTKFENEWEHLHDFCPECMETYESPLSCPHTTFKRPKGE